MAVRRPRRPGPRRRDDQRRGRGRARRPRPGPAGGSRRAVRLARPGRRVRLRARRSPGCSPQWAPARLVLPFAVFIGLRDRGDRRRAGDPRARPRRLRAASEACARASRPRSACCSRARASPAPPSGPSPRSSCRSSRLTRPNCWTRANLALLGAISGLVLGASCAAQIARPPRHRPRPHAGHRARPARRRPARARAGLPHPFAARPARRRRCSPAPATASRSSAAQAQLNLAAPADRRGEVNAAFYTLIYLGVASARRSRRACSRSRSRSRRR